MFNKRAGQLYIDRDMADGICTFSRRGLIRNSLVAPIHLEQSISLADISYFFSALLAVMRQLVRKNQLAENAPEHSVPSKLLGGSVEFC